MANSITLTDSVYDIRIPSDKNHAERNTESLNASNAQRTAFKRNYTEARFSDHVYGSKTESKQSPTLKQNKKQLNFNSGDVSKLSIFGTIQKYKEASIALDSHSPTINRETTNETTSMHKDLNQTSQGISVKNGSTLRVSFDGLNKNHKARDFKTVVSQSLDVGNLVDLYERFDKSTVLAGNVKNF